MIELTERSGCSGTSISFNEPTLSLEWSLDVFRLARAHGLYNTYVTNGYMTPEALDALIDAGLDAMNVDVKGDAAGVRKYCKGIDVEQVWAACRLARARGVHVEITTLIVPTVNDAPTVLHDLAARIATELGPEVAWHVSGYYPAYQFTASPTPPRTLERAWHIGREAGLEFVYVGNVPGHRYDNTHCPQCSTLLIERRGFEVIYDGLHQGKCLWCRALAGGHDGDQERCVFANGARQRPLPSMSFPAVWRQRRAAGADGAGAVPRYHVPVITWAMCVKPRRSNA
jgi:pyruvate formate lyase activating enzyme